MNRQWIFALAIAALMAGCAASPQPFEYHDDRDEKPGPGLFSGDRGGFVIQGESRDGAEEKKIPEAPLPEK
ncbi:hypothetical protein [uncultured Desulfosarcina sp.]|uniref:hypothetical protein n=1 Tax=uncultured Desulfosarcina sp. TaxID=218289 RepID=UPI0029C75D77|nr:hypothetical protein [uncultured Desulfosarcina sp.]